jgi:hypothetical protein
MAIELGFFRQSISSILQRNPIVSNDALAGAMRCNMVNFRPHLQISDLKSHSFQSGGIRKPVKMVYVSSYGFWMDLLVSITRVFTGKVFPPVDRNGNLLSDVLAGRRLTIFCSLDGQEAEVVSEVDQKPLHVRLRQAVKCAV